MKERPILFNAEMVRAILEGRKTQTRRVIDLKGSEQWWLDDISKAPFTQKETGWFDNGLCAIPSKYGRPGDRLWVRENWRTDAPLDKFNATEMAKMCIGAGYTNPWSPIQYETDGAYKYQAPLAPGRLRVSRFMPRWASRITLEVTDIRVERVQDISEEDAVAEGICKVPGDPGYFDYLKPRQTKTHRLSAQDSFRTLWDFVNTKRGLGWDLNPWVWVIEFKRVEA